MLNIKLSSLNLIPEKERRRLLHEFNDTRASYPDQATLHQVFEEKAQMFASRIALRCRDEEMTYAELNRQANVLAAVLREQGVKPNRIVGILCSRSPKMVISILAVLKAGGAYMPIDPEYPEERIHFMLEDSGAVLCIAEEPSLIPKDAGIRVLPLGDAAAEWRSCHMDNPASVTQSSDLAYIIYTSGSTGKPKGVMIEHRNVVRLLMNDKSLFDFGEDDVWTLFHSFCFDFSVWEMYGALLFGGTLVIVPSHVAREPKRFLELLRREGVTILNQTPTSFYSLAKVELEPGTKSDLRLRMIIFGGEALQPAQLAGWRTKYPHTALINMYGITETTVHATYKEIGEPEVDGRSSSIGRPIPTLQIYVLDEDRSLVPIGVEGEIYVGGEGVARGYVNRPELTEERFVPHPFEPGARLYRSGDLARWNTNGELEYVGRIDHQVKIRGFRIELGEIEARLLQIPDIQQAVVAVKKDPAGEDKICAYYVSERVHRASELRASLSRHLPQYMLPAYYFPLASIPMTSNNKVDAGSLPAPGESVVPDEGAELVMPENDVERHMLMIWQKMLHTSNIGTESNYFELGGDSIRAIDLISRMNRELRMSIQIVDLYRHPTIKGLIRNCSSTHPMEEAMKEMEATLDRQRAAWLGNPVYRALLPPHTEDLFPMSDIQQGMVFHYIKHEGSGMYHDQFIYRMKTKIDSALLREAMSALVRRHPMLRTGFNISDFPVPVQYVCGQIDIRVNEVALASTSAESVRDEITLYMEQDRALPFVIQQAPLWRIVLFTSEQETYLGWIFHHAILDGWSVAVLISELLHMYGVMKGEEVIA